MGEIEIVRVVIDTNVIVSALLFAGTLGRLVKLWKSGRIQPVASKEIIDEYLKVLAYPKFELSEEEIAFLLYHEILPYFEAVRAKSGPVIVQEDPSDDKFLHCAVAGNARTIISGDEHLLALRSHGKVRIVTPSAFLRELR